VIPAPAHCRLNDFYLSPVYTCAVGLHAKTCWLHNINLVKMLKLVKCLWTEIRNLDGILDGIGDFGRTQKVILDSMFSPYSSVVCGLCHVVVSSNTFQFQFSSTVHLNSAEALKVSYSLLASQLVSIQEQEKLHLRSPQISQIVK